MGILGALFGNKAAKDHAYAEWMNERALAAIVSNKWEIELNSYKADFERDGKLKEWQLRWLMGLAQTAITLHREKYQLTTRTKSNIL